MEKSFLVMNAQRFIDEVKTLSCPICLDIIVDARELPCQHIFCESCWNEYRGERNVALCPICKIEVPKRKFLKQDEALNNLCIFVRKLRDDFKRYYKTDVSSYLATLNNAEQVTVTSVSDLVPNIQQSSEDTDIIPCSNNSVKSKTTTNPKKALKKSVGSERKSETKHKKLDIKRQTPKRGTSKVTPEHQIPAIEKNRKNVSQEESVVNLNKNKIVQWLSDTRNRFDRLSQTQASTHDKNTQDIDMPSISQICSKKKLSILKNFESEPCKMQGLRSRKAKSFENLIKNKGDDLKRHSSLESIPASRSHAKKKIIENKLIDDIIQDEVLDSINKDFPDDQNEAKSHNPSKINRRNSQAIPMNTTDNKILVVELNNGFLKEKRTACTSSNKEQEKKAKSSWKSINTLQKTIGKTRARKKLDISVQITQKQGKLDSQQEPDLGSCGLSKTIESVDLKTKMIDLHTINVTKTIPESLEITKCKPSQEVLEEIRIVTELPHSNSKENSVNNSLQVMEAEKSFSNNDESNESDIYIFQTQSFSHDSNHNEAEYAMKVANKLKVLLVSLENKNRTAAESVYKTVKAIFDIKMSNNNNKKSQSNSTLSFENKMENFCEKGIQTDYFAFDGFNISSTAAFKSLSFDNATTQTDTFCIDCPHIQMHHSNSVVGNEQNCSQTGECSQKKCSVVTDGTKTLTSQRKEMGLTGNVDYQSQVFLNKHDSSLENIPENRIESAIFEESEIPMEEILNCCNSKQETVKIFKDKSNDVSLNCSIVDPAKKDNLNLDSRRSSQNSAIICTLPSNNMKRIRRENSNLDFDSERSAKIKCFKENQFSIQFETETNEQQYSTISHKHESNRDGNMNKPQDPEENEALLGFSDDLIRKMNKQIENEQVTCEPTKMHQSQQKTQVSDYKEEVHARQKYDTIKTQDLLKHCDEIIEKTNQQIGIENIVQNKEKNYQIASRPLSQKIPENVRSRDTQNSLPTEDLLNHCQELIEKTARDLGKELRPPTKDMDVIEIESDSDDDLLCQNLEHIDNIIQEANNMELPKRLAEKSNDNVSCSGVTPKSVKRKNTDHDDERHKKIMILQNVPLGKPEKRKEGFSSSDDEIFSDLDIVETTPQKTKASSKLERFSGSAAPLSGSRLSHKFSQINDDCLDVEIVPPPPGFGDKETDFEKEPNVSKIMSQYDTLQSPKRESENIIPNSLSPERVNIALFNQPTNSRNLSSQEFMNISPICSVKPRNANMIDMIRESKLSPLTIVPKASLPISSLTSTPKQKTMLNYVMQRTQPTQSKGSRSMSQATPPLKRKPCIAFSRLGTGEAFSIHSLCLRELATRRDKVESDVTHVIVSVNKNNCVKDLTIKYLQAIAAGLWVVNINWIKESLAQNKIVDEEPYEVSDESGIPSPRISRLSRSSNPLFKRCKFYLHGPFTQVREADIERLIELLSGSLVKSVEDFSQETVNFTCVIISEGATTQDSLQYENWLETYKIVTVDINWLTLSIARYKLLSFKSYLLCSEDCLDELGYEENLIADVPYSESQE